MEYIFYICSITYKINDSLLGFDLKKGKNNIELKYIPNNLDIGISISITTLIITITYLIIKKMTLHLINSLLKV